MKDRIAHHHTNNSGSCETMEQEGLVRHWEKIYRIQKNDFRAKSLEVIILKDLGKQNEILDLGCGTCGLTLSLLENGFNVTSVDSSDEMLEMGKEILARNGLPHDRVFKSDIESFSKSNRGKFDRVICLDVIEHLENDAAALAQINVLLKDDGVLILSVPAHPDLYGPKDVELGHFRRYSKKDLLKKMRDSGFDVLTVRYWNFSGAVVTWLMKKIFNKRVGEDFRYRERSIQTTLLKHFFLVVENNVRPPFGMTLFVTARRSH